MHLDEATLAVIRDIVAEIKASPGHPRDAVARLAGLLPPGLGLTLDLEAAKTLGESLVILRPSADPDPGFEHLTPREREVAGLVATGLRNKDIAVALGITLATVKDHVHRILEKTGLDSRAAVAARLSDRR
jgi:DNA-binding NarL/FixJ family response regulator